MPPVSHWCVVWERVCPDPQASAYAIIRVCGGGENGRQTADATAFECATAVSAHLNKTVTRSVELDGNKIIYAVGPAAGANGIPVTHRYVAVGVRNLDA